MAAKLAFRYKKKVQPSPQDRARLDQLYQEIAERAAEASSIFARVVGWEPNRKISPMNLPSGISAQDVIKGLEKLVSLGKKRSPINVDKADETTVYISGDGGTDGVDDATTGL